MNYWRKRKNSFRYAIHGIGTFIKETPHAQIHLIITVVVLLLGALLKIGLLEWLILIGMIAIVFVAEALNSSLEYLSDAIHPDRHPLIKKAKDVGAGAVLIAAILAAISGITIFGSKILIFLSF